MNQKQLKLIPIDLPQQNQQWTSFNWCVSRPQSCNHSNEDK